MNLKFTVMTGPEWHLFDTETDVKTNEIYIMFWSADKLLKAFQGSFTYVSRT